MDFIYDFLANFYIVFLILGIIFALGLLGILSKITKRKQKKKEILEEIKKEEEAEQQTKQSKLTPTIQPPGNTVIDTPFKEEEQEVFIEPSLDDLEVHTSDPEPTYTQPTYNQPVYNQPTYNMSYTQPMPYIDPNMQYMNQMPNQYIGQPTQYVEQNMIMQQQMMMQQQMQMQQGMQQQMVQPIVQEPVQETIEFITEPANEVTETIEFFELDENPKEAEKVEIIPQRKFDIEQAKALAEELASKQPVNESEVYDAEPTFGLVIEDTGSSVGTDI